MMTLEATTNLIRSRRAIRRYLDKPVPRQLVEHLLQTAVYSPSAHNRQPWRFAVLSKQADKENLAAAMGKRLQADRLADGDAIEVIQKDVARSHTRITSAPVVIIVCLSMVDMDIYADQKRALAERTMTIQSVAMAAQSLWLLAHSAGLAACWLCAPLFVPKLVQKTMVLPTDWEPQGLMTLGWPAETKTKSRHDWRLHTKFIT